MIISETIQLSHHIVVRENPVLTSSVEFDHNELKPPQTFSLQHSQLFFLVLIFLPLYRLATRSKISENVRDTVSALPKNGLVSWEKRMIS